MTHCFTISVSVRCFCLDQPSWVAVALNRQTDRHTEAVSSFFHSLSLNTDLLPPMRRLKGVFEMFGTWLYSSACSTFRWCPIADHVPVYCQVCLNTLLARSLDVKCFKVEKYAFDDGSFVQSVCPSVGCLGCGRGWWPNGSVWSET